MHPGVVHAHPRKCKVETLYEGFPPTHFDAVLVWLRNMTYLLESKKKLAAGLRSGPLGDLTALPPDHVDGF